MVGEEVGGGGGGGGGGGESCNDIGPTPPRSEGIEMGANLSWWTSWNIPGVITGSILTWLMGKARVSTSI